ncbi:hypothetical protein DL96DRAFT_34602 [Flagelloscypha sp. PMI_526]|nr:hypothetical protein DL96DRAFT_34602 [Flagelloscypha sp. PMI_526]
MKKFLDYHWLDHCLSAGRLLLEADNYGECLIKIPSSTEPAYPSPETTPQPHPGLVSSEQVSQPPPLITPSTVATNRPTVTPEIAAQFMNFMRNTSKDSQIFATLQSQLSQGPSPPPVSGGSVATPPPITPSYPEKLFTRLNGEPLQFVVDVHLGSSRKPLVQLIKSNGGIIVPEDGDYAILNPSSTYFSAIKDSMTADLIKRSWVEDSVRQGQLLDPAGYLLLPPKQNKAKRPKTSIKKERISPGPSSLSKKSSRSSLPHTSIKDEVVIPHKPSASNLGESSKPSLGWSSVAEKGSRPASLTGTPSVASSPKGKQKQIDPSPPITHLTNVSHSKSPVQTSTSAPKRKQTGMEPPEPGERPKQRRKTEPEYIPPLRPQPSSSSSSPVIASSSRRRPPPRIPSPELPDIPKVEFTTGKYRYTPEEYEFARKYIEVLIHRNPEIPKGELGRRLHTKFPHHSPASWDGKVPKIPNLNMAQVLKSAGIAYRKYQATGKHPMAVDDPEVLPGPQGDSDTSTISSTPQSALPVDWSQNPERPLKESLRLIANFYARRLGEDGADQTANWERMTRMYSVPNGFSSWNAFYDLNNEGVKAEYDMICAEVAKEQGVL